MGNDGGSIPDRRDLVRTKPKAEQADKANQTKAKWFFCALSKRKLHEPIVSCVLGKLYNKDSIIEFLLDRGSYGDGENICGHVRSLKDVKTLKLTLNTAPLSSNGNSESTERAQFVCPLSMKEMNGSKPFVYIDNCGCVFSRAGLRTLTSSRDKGTETEGSPTPPSELPNDVELCPNCATKYTKDDVVLLNPGPEEEETLRFALERQRLQESAKKKSKKRKHESDVSEPPKKRQEMINAAVVTVTNRGVATELEKEEAKRKATMSATVKSLYEKGTTRKETFMTRTFTRYA